MIVDDRYLVLYGGTNGYKFFDNLMRYDMQAKSCQLMTKYPTQLQDSSFLKDGRIACSACQNENFAVLFGGCSAAQDEGDFLVLPFAAIREDANFSDISVIM